MLGKYVLSNLATQPRCDLGPFTILQMLRKDADNMKSAT